MEWENLPRHLRMNAYAPDLSHGQGAQTRIDPLQATAWALRQAPPDVRPFLSPRAAADPRDWQDERVGFGVILADRDELSSEQRSSGSDAPEPIYALIRERKAAVFRYRRGEYGLKYLRMAAHRCDTAIEGAPIGMPDDKDRRGFLPRYLFIYGGPEEIPWTLQYILNVRRGVGRLHLQGSALERYVACVLNGWRDASADRASTVVWATDHHKEDITHLMRSVIAEPLAERYAGDPDIQRAVSLTGKDATRDALAGALAAGKPAMIVTTSHGQTTPLGDPERLVRQLGLPVDSSFETLDTSTLLARWQPAGAIWYAHACCSAGSDGETAFRGLVPQGSMVENILEGIARAGANVAPLPTALLSANDPARAFIGHVEPTFDVTLRDPINRQTFGTDLTTALYDNLFLRKPIGLALGGHYARIGTALSSYENNMRTFNQGGDGVAGLLGSRLVAEDIQSVVILGDPLAALA